MPNTKPQGDAEAVEAIAREWFAHDRPNITWEQADSIVHGSYLKATEYLLSDPAVAAYFRKKVLGEWIDEPIKAGDYWVSPFVGGRYISPRIMRVIDYQRAERGLEVDYDFPHNTIPVKNFVEEYYPKAKWMFINEPECWQALSAPQEVEG